MNLHLQPKQVIILYNCIKTYESQYSYCNEEEGELLNALKVSVEDAIAGAFEKLELQASTTAYDKWVESEKSKIEGLEKELEKIKESVPVKELIKKFQPVKVQKAKGRPKKSK